MLHALAVVASFLAVVPRMRHTELPATQPVADLLARVLGETTASIFELNLDSSSVQGFKLENSPVTGSLIKVTASGLPELAYGAAFYLRTHAGMSFAWENTGGNQVRAPKSGFPKLSQSVVVAKKVKWSYYQNVCTQSYSMWYVSADASTG
jgi:hypothetical protein